MLGEFHGQRSLVGYSPWGGKELNMTEQLTHTHTHTLTHTEEKDHVNMKTQSKVMEQKPRDAKIARKPPEVRGEAMNQIFPHNFRSNQPY